MLNLRTAALALLLAGSSSAQGQTCYGGICFSAGDVSFADALIRYDPLYSGLCGPTAPNFVAPASALGPPDYTGGSAGFGSVSLGQGGLIEVAFVDNVLVNSGTTATDLHIFEVGPAVEACFIAVRPSTSATRALLIAAGVLDANADGFFEVGAIGGSVASIDLDAWAPGLPAGALEFDAVQIVDDPNDTPGCDATVGADLDAVGATYASALPPLATVVCNGVANSTGVPGRMNAFGSDVALDNDLFLLATDLPTASFGYFICSLTSVPPVTPPGSQGHICLGGSVGRYVGPNQIQRTGFSGTFGLELDLTATPQPTGFVSVQAGATWNFQTWHRDVAGGMATSNFTDAVAVSFL